MNNSYTSEILMEYEKIRDENKRKLQQKKDYVYKKFPKIKEIDSEISEYGINIAASVIKGADMEKTIGEAKKKMTDLKIEKSEILAENGLPVDYLEASYNCKKCKDTGYIGSEKCTCFKQKLINKYYQQSNLKNVLMKENFDTFDISLYSHNKVEGEDISPFENMQKIFKHSIDYVNNFDNTNENLLFYGNSGLGKTFLSNCIAKDLLDRGKLVVYETSSNLIDILRNAKFDESSTKEELEKILDNILTCDLLIIDDLGTEPATSYSYSELFNIINSRLLKQKKTIISTNYTINDLTNLYPERITSRILGNYTVFKFIGDDIRINRNSLKKQHK